MLDESSIVAIIVVVLYFLSPVLNSVFSHRSQLRMKRIEICEAQRISAAKAYMKAAGELIQNETPETRAAYGRAYGEVYFFAPPDLWPDIEALNKALLTNKVTLYNHADFTSVCQRLSLSLSDLERNPDRRRRRRQYQKRNNDK